MGFPFRSSAPGDPEKSRKNSQEMAESASQEKSHHSTDLTVPASRQSSSRIHSSRASFAGSVQSSFTEDIKHEVMCNFLYQQQCSKLWIADGSGQMEGIMVKKGRNEYISCPPALAQSEFAACVAALNAPVFNFDVAWAKPQADWRLGHDDCKLPHHQYLPELDSRCSGRPFGQRAARTNPSLDR